MYGAEEASLRKEQTFSLSSLNRQQAVRMASGRPLYLQNISTCPERSFPQSKFNGQAGANPRLESTFARSAIF
jgi:hypothetical protein